MCEECLTLNKQKRIEYCGCGCVVRRFLTPAEKIERLGEYKTQLEKEVAGVERTIKEIQQESGAE